ncbi:tail fiber protein [Klebsiella phage vB_KpM_Centimanus]
MANDTRKISELSSKGIVPESALLPVAVAGAEKETYRTTLNNLRSNLLFENAYETLAEGIAATVKDEVFYVYTDESQFYVAAFTNVNGASATALYKDNTPVIYGTGKMMADGKFGSYTSYVSYLYNNGSANGGETEITLPFDCFDVSEMFLNGGHQFKGLNYTFDRLSNKVKLKGALTAGAFVVFYVRPYPGTPVTPVEPGITDYVNVTWLYNDGAAVGGETSLTPPWTFSTVPAIYINGSKQVLNKHYEVDSTGLKINLSKALNANDVVEVILGGSRSIITAQVSGTPAEVLLTLGQTTGATKVNTSYGVSLEQVVQGFYGVNSFDDLRNRRPNFEGEKVNLKGYYSGSTSGGGQFIGHIGTGTDDGGTVAAGSGFYWERVNISDTVDLVSFGLVDGGVIDTPLTNAINFCIKTAKKRVVIPSLGPLGYTLNGGLTFINSSNEIIIEGPGMATKGISPVITHTGSNIGITFKRQSQAQSLLNKVTLKNFTVVGNANAIAFVRFSDFYGGTVKDSVIRDYTTGTCIDYYNDLGWTEVAIIDNVVLRTSSKGIWFHSNPTSTDWQTLSFYGANISNFYFQHGITDTSTAIYVGDGTRADSLYNCYIDMGGWFEQGGNSTAILVSNNANIDGKALFRYDGFNGNSVSSSTQSTRLVKKLGNSGWVNLDCINYKFTASIPLDNTTTSLTIRPWLALAEAAAGNGTSHPTRVGESIVRTKGLRCKLTGVIYKGVDNVVRVRSLLPWHRYKVTLRSDISSTAQQEFIINLPNANNAGVTTRTDSLPAVTFDSATSTVTVKNKVFEPINVSNVDSLADNTYSTTSNQGFDLNIKGTSGAVTLNQYNFSIEIEAID